MANFKEQPESNSTYYPDKGYGDDTNAVTIQRSHMYAEAAKEIEPILPTIEELNEGINLMRMAINMNGNEETPKSLDFLISLWKKLR